MHYTHLRNGVLTGGGIASPINTVAPTITGVAMFGRTLTGSTGTWTGNPSTYAYQWNRNGVAIGSATASTYVLVTADVGTTITLTVTANIPGTGGVAATSAGVGPVLPVPVANDITAPLGVFEGLGNYTLVL